MKDENKSGKNAPEHSDEPDVEASTEKNDGGKTPAAPSSQEFDGIETAEMHNESLKERYEEKRNAKLIKYEELINIAPDFAIWLKQLVRYGNVDSQVLIYWYCFEDKPENRFNCLFYTDTKKYSISGYVSVDNKSKGYLGCIASTRKSRVGEDWHRGSDLPDGEYSKKTFNKIVHGIVGYELKSLQLWRKS